MAARSAAKLTWAEYRESIGDRSPLFAAVADVFGPQRALYPGSYVDLSPSTAIPSVTYVDMDARAARFFGDEAAVQADLAGRTRPGAGVEIDFLAADFTEPLPLAAGSMDLLIALYAGGIWDHCRRYLRPGGLFLANASHGDASLAALAPEARLVAAVLHRDGQYRLDTDHLDGYLVPKRPAAADADRIRSSGRGIAYTRGAFAYLFVVD